MLLQAEVQQGHLRVGEVGFEGVFGKGAVGGNCPKKPKGPKELKRSSCKNERNMAKIITCVRWNL